MRTDHVFVLAPPRSGTKLLSRMLGRSEGTYLITEHTRKPPEEINQAKDQDFWLSAVGFSNSPSEEVDYDADKFQSLNVLWNAKADGKRLIIKNPQNVARVAALRTAFPEAQFVWLIRDPWFSIQSMLGGDAAGHKNHMVVRASEVFQYQDPLAQCAATWALALDRAKAYKRDTDATIRYEALLADPKKEMVRLSKILGLTGAIENGAADLPRKGRTSIGLMQYLLYRCGDADKVVELIEPRARELGYPLRPVGRSGEIISEGVRYFLRWCRKPEWRLPYGYPIARRFIHWRY